MGNSSTITVTPSELSSKISKAVSEYVDDYEQMLQETATQITQKAKKELKSVSPKETGEYSKGWAIKQQKGTHQYRKVIYNKSKPSIVHLLEFGHANRDGTRTPAIPHVRETELKYQQEFVDELKAKTRKGV